MRMLSNVFFNARGGEGVYQSHTVLVTGRSAPKGVVVLLEVKIRDIREFCRVFVEIVIFEKTLIGA
jgi:hypothetical protein